MIDLEKLVMYFIIFPKNDLLFSSCKRARP